MRTAKTDQTGRMPRLICLRWTHSHFAGFVMSRLIGANKCNKLLMPLSVPIRVHLI